MDTDYIKYNTDIFNKILNEITPAIGQMDTVMRQCIKQPERLQLKQVMVLLE